MPTIQKTRLIHAAVCHFITRSGKWDLETDGVPVCQQDMVGSLLIFSVQVIDGMRRMGIAVTEAEDYYDVWRVTGAMLGIPEQALPTTLTEARELNRTLVETSYGPSPEGIQLTAHLLDLCEKLFPGKMFDGIVAALVRQVVNERVADWLQVPDSRGWQRVARIGTRVLGALERAEDDSRFATKILDKAGELLLGGSVRTLTDGQSTTLDIPADLRERWQAHGLFPAEPPPRSGREPATAPSSPGRVVVTAGRWSVPSGR